MCPFCGVEACTGQCDPQLEARLAVYQQLSRKILRQVDKIGRERLKKAFPELLEAIDPLNIAHGVNMAKTFVERYQLADAVADRVAQGKPVSVEVHAYIKHRKTQDHAGFTGE